MTRLSFIKRDDIDLDITITDLDGTAVNLTDCTVFFTMKNRKTDSDDDAVLKKEVSIHTVPTEGKTRISLSNTETNLRPKFYVYDLQVKNGMNKILSTESGVIVVTQDVTIRTA